ncbi:SDR family oxidoreductase [Paenibacillus agricola]|uniref:SDR family oxidoreductase n=1 Tax=Paenibacillus agricola TaxID=2716264 RepID=A0ABX0JDH2_9BACL|nr:SDR family oxidoreductase [Paenibacillus agricola]NHN33998.1 SDR family oxidoreductase [Paenibacillus agricola]
MELKDRIAVVTGGSQGIGFATVQALAKESVKVIALVRDLDVLNQSLDSLGAASKAQITGIRTDVRDENDVQQTFKQIITEFGHIDILVNCAGVSMSDKKRLEDSDTAEWKRIIDTNLTGTYLMCREALPLMISRNSGFIINILSTAAYKSSSGNSLYAASKFGVRALTEAMIEENRRSGIRISSISPGAVDTPIWNHKTNFVTPEDRATMLRPEDISSLVMYLLCLPMTVHIENMTVTPWLR